MGHHIHLFVSKNGQKLLKTGFRGYYLHNKNKFYGQQVVFNYPMVSPKVPATLKIPYSTLWATIATHLLAKMAENG
jgi:hypothetical protein